MTSSRSKDGGGLMSRIRNALFALPAVILVFLASCAGTDETAFGQSVDRAGVITDRSLAFTFAAPRGKKSAKDLFDYLYFQGDTVCFSYRFPRSVEKCDAAAEFINPQTGERFHAERLEKTGNRLWGFSLAGSLLDKFFFAERDRPAPSDLYGGRDIPFIVEAELRCPGEPIVSKSGKSSFRIEYRTGR